MSCWTLSEAGWQYDQTFEAQNKQSSVYFTQGNCDAVTQHLRLQPLTSQPYLRKLAGWAKYLADNKARLQ